MYGSSYTSILIYTHTHSLHTHTRARTRRLCVCKLGWMCNLTHTQSHVHRCPCTHTHTYIHARTRVRLASRTSVRFCSGSPYSSNAVVYGQFCDCVPHSECNIRVAFTGTHLNAESFWQLNPFLNWADVCSDSSTNYDSSLNRTF